MNELEQAQDEILVRVIGALVVVAIIIGLTGLFAGFSVAGFIRISALLAIAGIAYGLRSTGRVVAASQTLILLLAGFVVVAFFQTDSINLDIPYLLIPVAIITGWLLNAWLGLAVVVTTFVALALIAAVFQGGDWGVVRLLAVPFLAAATSALLNVEGKRQMIRLWERLQDNRAVLKARTRAVMEAQDHTGALQQRLTALQTELTAIKTKSQQVRLPAANQYDQLSQLLSVTAQELESGFQELEHDVEQLASSNSQVDGFSSLWQRLDHLKGLVINLEEIVQIEQEDLQLHYEPIDLPSFIGNVVVAAQNLARAKDVGIRVDVPDDLPPLQADPVRLRQALLHLLSNAANAPDQGEIEFRAESLGQDLRLLVSDSGTGIGPEQANRIFGLSGHGDEQVSRSAQTGGLGLVVARRLVELHQGRIWATGVSGVGSTIYIDLPFSPLDPSVTELQPPVLPSPIDESTTELAPAALRLPELRATPAVSGEFEPFISASPVLAEIDLNDAPTLISQVKNEPEIVLADDASTQIFRSPSEASLASDPHATSISSAGRYLSTPVSRRTSIYVRRFSLILVGLLLVIAGIVGLLAIINGPVETRVSGLETATAESPARSMATDEPDVSLPSPTFLASRASATALPEASIAEPAATSPTATLRSIPTSEADRSGASDLAVFGSATATLAVVESAATPTSVPTVSLRSSPTPLPTRTLTPPSLEMPGVTLTEASPAEQLAFLSPELLTRAGSEVKPNLDGRIEWSGAGRAIFAGELAGERDIYVVNGTRGRLVKLTATSGDDLQPAWSPDGSQIAFSSGRTGNFEIYVMNADGSNLTQLTTSRGFDEWPVWSPNGRQIAFVSDREGNVELYLMDADGSNQQRLTNNPANDWPASWSPDGRRLVFASDRDGDWNLYLLTLSDSVATRLTNASGDERDPVWSPDGKRIVFAYSAGGSFDIYTLPVPIANSAEVARSAWTQVTDTPQDERYPSWRSVANGQ